MMYIDERLPTYTDDDVPPRECPVCQKAIPAEVIVKYIKAINLGSKIKT